MSRFGWLWVFACAAPAPPPASAPPTPTAAVRTAVVWRGPQGLASLLSCTIDGVPRAPTDCTGEVDAVPVVPIEAGTMPSPRQAARLTSAGGGGPCPGFDLSPLGTVRPGPAARAVRATPPDAALATAVGTAVGAPAALGRVFDVDLDGDGRDERLIEAWHARPPGPADVATWAAEGLPLPPTVDEHEVLLRRADGAISRLAHAPAPPAGGPGVTITGLVDADGDGHLEVVVTRHLAHARTQVLVSTGTTPRGLGASTCGS